MLASCQNCSVSLEQSTCRPQFISFRQATQNSQNMAISRNRARKCVTDSPSFCFIEWEFCLWSFLCRSRMATSRIYCNRYSFVAELSVSGPIRSNYNLFTLGVHAVLSSFRITSRPLTPHMFLYRVHVSMNNSQSPLLASSRFEGHSGLLTWSAYHLSLASCVQYFLVATQQVASSFLNIVDPW